MKLECICPKCSSERPSGEKFCIVCNAQDCTASDAKCGAFRDGF